MNQNVFSFFYSEGWVFLSLLWIQYFSTPVKVRDDIRNFSSQDKQSSIKAKHFVALAKLVSSLGGLLRDSGNAELNQPGISNLRFCQCFFVLNCYNSGVFSPQYLHLNYSVIEPYSHTCIIHCVSFPRLVLQYGLLVERKLSNNYPFAHVTWRGCIFAVLPLIFLHVFSLSFHSRAESSYIKPEVSVHDRLF